MTEKSEQARLKVPLSSFLADLSSSLSDQELRDKYDLSAKAFVSLIKALLTKNVISPLDLEKRKEMAVRRDLAKESQFLSGLYICPNCSHPHPSPFARCPACGAVPAEVAPSQEVMENLSASGDHFYIDESKTVRVRKRQQQDDYPPTEEVELFQEGPQDPPTELIATYKDKDDFPPTEEIRIQEEHSEPKKRKSTTDQIRSFLNKIKRS